ncbi:hypothetical protein ACQR1H_08870 [Bradyrhizobium sp. HKCCYLRH2015]|uniref:hypothetical protein n=1 Tax=Bradyrhizobium TaxID=374 RepID=UPI0028EB7D3D|nr:hypothetical protein [Bradyrhizobium sp. SZCCHNS3002]
MIGFREALRQPLPDARSSLGLRLPARIRRFERRSSFLVKPNRADISVALQHLSAAQVAAAGMCMARQKMSYVHHELPITNWAGSSWQDQR